MLGYEIGVLMEAVLETWLQVIQGLMMGGLLWYLSSISKTLNVLVTQQELLSQKLPYMMKDEINTVVSPSLKELEIKLSKNNELIRDLKAHRG